MSLRVDLEEVDLSSDHFVNDQTGWICGSYGTVLQTTDAGTTWHQLTDSVPSQQVQLNAIQAVNGQAIFIVGAEGTILRWDGSTWLLLDSRGVSHSFLGMHFVDENFGIVVGDGGRALITSSGGDAWTFTAVDSEEGFLTDKALHGAHFLDVNRGWIIGEQGLLLQTHDGGATWEFQESCTALDLHGIAVHAYGDGLLGGLGWMVGEEGKICATVDEGKTWFLQDASAHNVPLYRVGGYGAFNPISVGELGELWYPPTSSQVAPTLLDYRV
eukprot:gene7894-9377_t